MRLAVIQYLLRTCRPLHNAFAILLWAWGDSITNRMV
jgi:hypothetical protein